jgi:predicted metal-dependent phosphotriesterase family hydrolase
MGPDHGGSETRDVDSTDTHTAAASVSSSVPLCSVIRTTKGDIDSSLAGIVLPHEHLLLDFFYFGVGPLGDPSSSATELRKFVDTTDLPGVFGDATGRTVVEVSTRGLREEHYDTWKCPNATYPDPQVPQCQDRDAFQNRLNTRSYPLLLDDVASASGSNVVMSTGYYREYYHPPYMYDVNEDGSITYTMSEDEMVSRMVADIQQGVDGTNIRAGVIGEIGISRYFGVPDLAALNGEKKEHVIFEEDVLRAACRAHLATGAAMNIHLPASYSYNLENDIRLYDLVISILQSTGCIGSTGRTVSDRIVFDHIVSNADPDFNAKLEELAGRGINLAFDVFGTTDPPVVEDGSTIAALIEKGYGDKLLVSQDIYNASEIANAGYDYIVKNLAAYFKGSHTQRAAHEISADAKVWLADISGDGKADLVVQDPQGSPQNGAILVALSTNIGFDMWTSVSSTRVSNSGRVWLADVDGDGKADLVAQGGAPDSDHGQIYVALSTGTGFSMWTSVSDVRVSNTAKVWLADVNGDHKADLVAQGGAPDDDHGQIYVALSTGTGFSMWTSISTVRVSNTAQVWLADVNSDGKADLVAQGGAPDSDHGQIYLALSTGTGFSMWTSVSSVRVSNTAKVWLADVNGDDKADLVAQGGAPDADHGQIYIALSIGTGFNMWTSISDVRVGDTATVWFADVNGDARADLVARGGAQDDDVGIIYLGLSQGNHFQMWVSPSRVVNDNAQVWFADVNGDHKADLVVKAGSDNPVPGQVYVGLATDDGFERWTSASDGRVSNTARVWFADVDGDGRADLVAQGGAPGGDPGLIYVALSTGTGFGMWASVSTVRVSTTAKVWLADVDGDRRADLVAQGGAPDVDHGQIYVALSTGTGFSMWTSISTVRVSDTAQVWLADVDGDDKVDLVAQGGALDADHGQIFVALSTGTGFNMWTSISNVRVSNTAKVWLADVDGDGRADLVAQGGLDDDHHGQIHVALGTGTAFHMWTSVSDGRVSNTAKVWVVDVDGDGKADLVKQGGLDDDDRGHISVALSNTAGTGFEMWTSHTDESLVNDNGRVWFQNIAGGKAAEMVYLPSNNPNSYDIVQYFRHPIGVSARDMHQMMVVNTRRILQMTVPCGP